MSKLLNNLPIEDLTEENDYLGIIDKGQIIKTFLESNTDEFRDIKMFALYGEWGSGKSTLMKYLKKELKNKFNTFFFEAWQYESDDNLSLSLLEYLSYKSSDSTEEALGEIVEVAAKLFRGFSKSMRITVPGLSIDGSKMIESLEEEPEETFHQLKKKFETEFRKWEAFTTKGKKPKYNIVFIDDLDRCEPENVLNLLSALKLFFTYGEKTIFFCGIDKKAVNEAVKTKYGEVVKANEYLEKIFDISFSMPENNNLLKLISQYFDSRPVESIRGKLNENISSFFTSLKFTNPRRVKKVLNKYQLFRQIKESDNSKNQFTVPNVYTAENGNYFETITIIYLIILHEFYLDSYKQVFGLNRKEVDFLKIAKENGMDNYSNFRSNLRDKVERQFCNLELNKLNLLDNDYETLIFIFSPSDIQEVINTRPFYHRTFKISKFKSQSIELNFLNYLLTNINMFNNSDSFSNISLIEMKQIVKSFL